MLPYHTNVRLPAVMLVYLIFFKCIFSTVVIVVVVVVVVVAFVDVYQ
jgi:hypothetical protein